MALAKEIILDNGVQANYHLILNLHFIKQRNETVVRLATYISKEFREAISFNDLESSSVRILAISLVGEKNREQAYEAIKAKDAWNDATDI